MLTPDRIRELAAANRTRDFLVPFVEPSRRSAAEWAAERAISSLGGTKKPDVKFFRAAPETLGVVGSAAIGDTEIAIRNDLSLAETAGVAAHEAAHAFGIEAEDECRSIQRRVQSEWKAYRYQQRDLLAKRWENDSEKWFAMPSRTSAEIGKRLDALCIWMGVASFHWALASKEQELRYLELEELASSELGPPRYLAIPQIKPPRATYSFERALR